MNERVAAFFKYVQEHDEIADRLRAEKGNEDAFCRLAAELGHHNGYPFEPSDVLEALRALQAPPVLTEEELAAVAGGAGMTPAGMCYRGGGVGCAGSQTDALLNANYPHVVYPGNLNLVSDGCGAH